MVQMMTSRSLNRTLKDSPIMAQKMLSMHDASGVFFLYTGTATKQRMYVALSVYIFLCRYIVR